MDDLHCTAEEELKEEETFLQWANKELKEYGGFDLSMQGRFPEDTWALERTPPRQKMEFVKKIIETRGNFDLYFVLTYLVAFWEPEVLSFLLSQPKIVNMLSTKRNANGDRYLDCLLDVHLQGDLSPSIFVPLFVAGARPKSGETLYALLDKTDTDYAIEWLQARKIQANQAPKDQIKKLVPNYPGDTTKSVVY